MFFNISKKVTNIWATFVRKHVAKNFQKFVSLLDSCTKEAINSNDLIVPFTYAMISATRLDDF